MINKEALQTPMELLLVGGAVESDLFDALYHQPKNVEELAEKLNANRRAIWTVAEALVSLGYLKQQEGKYTLSPEALEIFYNTESINYEGFAFMHSYELIKNWIKLPEVIKHGCISRKERKPNDRRYFIEAMAHHARSKALEMAEFCLAGLPKGARVLDIGGGPLTYARAFASLEAEVTVLDMPEMVEMMKPSLAKGETIQMVPGDFTVGLPPGPYHLAYLGNICHIYGGSENRKLFKQVVNGLFPGGRIAIVDFVRGSHPFAALFAVNMLVTTESGGTWSLQEYTEWLADAGFNSIKLQEIADRQVITAQRT